MNSTDRIISVLQAERDVARHELAERNKLLDEVRKKLAEPSDAQAKVAWLVDRLEFSAAAR